MLRSRWKAINCDIRLQGSKPSSDANAISSIKYKRRVNDSLLARISTNLKIFLPKFPPSPHDQACKYQSPAAARSTYIADNLDISTILYNGNRGHKKVPALVQTPCFGHDSLGNNLVEYMETRICANLSGLHYLSGTFTYSEFTSDPFFQHASLPHYVAHPAPLPPIKAIHIMNMECTCTTMCHEKPDGLIHRHPQSAKAIFLQAINLHRTSHIAPSANLTPSQAYLYTSPQPHTTLPFIPDVAIHYRCGDNTNALYGFLPFRSFAATIPTDARYIYVLAEPSNRKTTPDQTSACNSILSSLHQYLVKRFPTSSVAILRGLDMFDDMVRLTFAKTLICSVSTFCLWPAISNEGTVYMPVSPLFAAGTTPTYGPNVNWLRDKNKFGVLQGIAVKQMGISRVLELLNAEPGTSMPLLH